MKSSGKNITTDEIKSLKDKILTMEAQAKNEGTGGGETCTKRLTPRSEAR